MILKGNPCRMPRAWALVVVGSFSPAPKPCAQRRTCRPARASISASPTPVQSSVESAITTRPPIFCGASSARQAWTTPGPSAPVNSGRAGIAPVATITQSAPLASARARVNGVFSLISTPWRRNSLCRFVATPLNSARPGNLQPAQPARPGGIAPRTAQHGAPAVPP